MCEYDFCECNSPTHDTRNKQTKKSDAAKVGLDAPAKQYLVRRSKKLPVWMWIPIAQSLGIKMNPNDRAIVATILYSLTVLSAFGNINN